jgi:uncharacterized membrane protein (Fun14 family)
VAQVVFIPPVDFSAVTVTFSWGPYLTLVPGIAIESHLRLVTRVLGLALLVVAWIGRIFMALGANVTLSAFGVELFPTSSRSMAAGMRPVFVTLGGV